MSNGRLHIHIGPPKTGTTALQVALQQIEADGFVYGGVFQPRQRNADSLSRALYEYVVKDISATSKRFSAARDSIMKLVCSANHILISEESFLVWSREITFVEKIDRLESALYGIPHDYILTARDPAQALPSYYQEMYGRLPLDQKIFSKNFFNHPLCDCYDYLGISRMLRDEYRVTVRIFDISDLSSGRLLLDDILGTKELFPIRIRLPKENVGRRDEVTGRRVFGAVLASDIARRILPQKMVDLVRTAAPSVVSRARRCLESVTVLPPRDRPVKVPPDRLEALRESYRQCRHRPGV